MVIVLASVPYYVLFVEYIVWYGNKAVFRH